MEKTYVYYFIALAIALILVLSSFVVLNNLFTQNSSNNTNTSLPLEQQINNDRVNYNLQFNGTRAFSYLAYQVNTIGYRPPNSTGIKETRVYIINQLHKFNWTVELNNFTYMGVNSTNILAFPGNSDRKNITLFGAHYDTRWWADDDPNPANRHDPVMGANDGASGVGALMEFAQAFANRTDVGLLFIDAEDQGGINGWVYSAGTYEFTNSSILDQYFPNGKSDIRVFILLDMIGDWHLNILRELNSNITYVNQIWNSASILGYSTYIINKPGYNMIDDHIPFLQAGIPAVDIIDYDYTDQNGLNLHHTIRDTIQYVSANSLWIVGQTIEYWLDTTTGNSLKVTSLQ